MTPKERNNHEIISGSRRKRIANGSGTTVQEVNQLLRQYAQMRKMFKGIGKGGGMLQRRAMSMLGGMRGR
jgi:signal recognition particle subunit SRP54